MNVVELFENITDQQRAVKQLPADFRPAKTSPQLSGPYPGRNATRGYLVGEDDTNEGYKILAPIDRERYTDIPGMEGPYRTMSGHVVYYDPKQGAYYDRDRDVYIDYDEYRQMDNDYRHMTSDKWSQQLRETLEENPMVSAVLRRIIHSHAGMLARHGAEAVVSAVEDVIGDDNDWDEIGSSDVSAYVKQVEDYLNHVNEVYNPLEYERQQQRAMDAERRRFKRDELEFELRGEEERMRAADSGTFYIRINGRIWRKAGEPVSFQGRQKAERAGQTIKNRDPQREVVITRSPQDKSIIPESYDKTYEDILTNLQKKLGAYLQDVATAVKKDPDLINKLPNDMEKLGPAVKTLRTDDGKEIKIHGNEDDGFRITINNKKMKSKFQEIAHAEMATEMYCARRREQSADYIDEA